MDGKFRRKGGNLKQWFKNIIVAEITAIYSDLKIYYDDKMNAVFVNVFFVNEFQK